MQTVIEVETVESVNNLEALAEWAPFGRLRPAFHLYVPAAMVEVAKRLCTDGKIPVAEIHAYHWIGDEMRFLPVYRAPADGRPRVSVSARTAPRQTTAPKKRSSKPGKTPRRKPAARSSRKAGRSPKRK